MNKIVLQRMCACVEMILQKENYVRMNKLCQSLAPLRFMSQTLTDKHRDVGTIHITRHCSFVFPHPVYPSLAFTLVTCNLICTHFRERNGLRIHFYLLFFLVLRYCYLLVGWLLFQGHAGFTVQCETVQCICVHVFLFSH